MFGGNNLDMQPTDLPSGLSPDNSDCAFLPGSVFTRPGLKRLLSLGTEAQVVYASTFLKPDGSVSQLTFTSDGKMYADGVQFGQTHAGNRFFTCNAFGKMYIATSDGLHGADVPLQYTPEGFLDRVSQDGPGAPPTVTNYALPAVALVAGSSGSPVTITNAVPIDPQQVQTGGGPIEQDGGYQPPTFETYYTALLFTTAAPHGLHVGDTIAIAGNSLYSVGTTTVSAVDSPTQFEVPYYTQSSATGTGGTVTFSAPLLVRTNNTVTATTAVPNKLRVGYKQTISGVPDASQSLTSIVVNNETLNGIGTVTTPGPHGFVPGNSVAIVGVQPAIVGGGVASWSIVGGILTMTTTSAHKLQPGDSVIQSTGTGFLVACSVDTVVSPTVITIAVPGATASSGTVATLTTPFPLPSGTVVTVASVPSSTTFQIAMTGADATFTTGNITFPWNGQFYVTSVLSPTSFTYNQTGPNASIQSGSGMVAPTGQISPGQHSIVEIFRTRTGYLTIPSPPVQITASGGQYLLITSTAIGPPNVTERWFGITGANGGNYFVLPVTPRDPAGQFAIGTATVIPDNITNSAIFDFTDESLFAGIAIDIPGNNLFRQQVLGPVLGFFNYGSRLMSWGERNKVQFFKNMGFEGGVFASAPNNPLGWTVTGTDGTLTAGDYGLAWTAGLATISQSAYQNQNGTAIIQPNTQYTYRAWVSGQSTATLSSATTGFSSKATISGTGQFVQADFSLVTPLTIPSDLTLTLSQINFATVDEVEIIYTENPYILLAKASYVNNPEAIDGVTCTIGEAGDPHPVMGMEERKDVLYFLTAGPEGSLYETEQTASGEPVTWNIRHVASKCGIISVWGMAKFEDWFLWTSDTGLRIFDGANVEKMSQEIQPWWDNINPAAKQFTVLANDPYTRRAYICAAQGSSVMPVPYVLDYRDLNTAGLLANSGTLRIGYTGKVVTTDLTRKWSPWSMTVNYCGLLTLASCEAVMTFCGGRGSSIQTPWVSAVYELEEGTLSGNDQDYGAFWQNSTYATYFFVSTDDAEQKQLGTHRLLHSFLTTNCTGVGSIFFVPNLDRIGNVGMPTRAIAVTEELARDLEFGLNLAAERISYRLCCKPSGPQPYAANAPAGFRLSSMTLAVKTHPFSPIRGKNS